MKALEKLNIELLTVQEKSILNEYQADLHKLTMREALVKNIFLCPAYKRVLAEMKTFDQTNLDYFNYEKEIAFGKSN